LNELIPFMIVMLNGAFGVGKTTIARRLVATLPNAMLYDPEHVGAMLRKLTNGIRTGAEDTDDYQDITLWRLLTVSTAKALREQYGRTLVVPMTLVNLAYFRAIKDGLTELDANLHHFCLTASARTIRWRLLRRGTLPRSWAWQRTERCVRALAASEFAVHVATEGWAVEEVVKSILKHL
jgi:cytidylate kinase